MRTRYILLIAAGLLGAATVFVINPSNKTHQKQRDQLIAELRAQGLPASTQDIISWLPPLPPNNTAPQYLQIFEQYEKVYTTTDIPDELPFFGDANTVEDITSRPTEEQLHQIKTYLQPFSDTLKDLRQINPTLPCQYPADNSKQYQIFPDYLTKHRTIARLLQLDSLLANNQNHPTRVYNNILRTLQLADALEAEPTYIAQLVRISVIALALNQLELQMHHAPPSRTTAAALYDHMKSLNLHDDLIPATYVETAFILTTQNIEEMTKLISDFPTSKEGIARAQLQAVTATRMLRTHLVNRTYTGMQSIGTVQNNANNISTFFQYHEHSSHNQIASLLQATTQTQTRIHTAEAALACHLHLLDHNTYPSKHADLVPAYLPSIPTDIYTEKPLRYLLDPASNSMVVYSVGPDGKDNRGRARDIHNHSTYGRKPDHDQDSDISTYVYTDITFCLGQYQAVHFQ